MAERLRRASRPSRQLREEAADLLEASHSGEAGLREALGSREFAYRYLTVYRDDTGVGSTSESWVDAVQKSMRKAVDETLLALDNGLGAD